MIDPQKQARAGSPVTTAATSQGRPDPRSDPARADRTAAAAIIGALEAAGIDCVFGIPGGPISPVTDALLDTAIEYVTCQHETMAVYAATGYSRATGRPGVVLVTSGPGVLNAMTGLAAAYQDEAPVVLLVGEVATGNQARGALQDGSAGGLDVANMVRSVTKLVETLGQPGRARPLTEQALRTAQAVPRGPAVLCLPVDLTRTTVRPTSVGQSVLAAPPPDAALCREIGGLLAGAHRPALFVGGGAARARLGPAIAALAEWTRCPVMTDLEAKGLFPETHPLSLGVFGVGGTGRAARYLAAGVDCLVLLGARLDDTTTANYSDQLRQPDTLVQIDHDERRLCRAYPTDIALACDLGAAVEAIHANTRVSPTRLLERDRHLRSVKRTSRSSHELGDRLGHPPHDPNIVIRALQRAFEPDTVYSCDIGNHLLFAGANLVLDQPDRFHVSMGLGGMTSGVGVAIGLQRGYGAARRVVGICGDGGLLMAGSELATCSRYRIPVTLAVFNDGQLGMVQHGSAQVFGRAHDWRTPPADFVAYARSLGAQARRIESQRDLERAARLHRDGPLLLDIPIDPSVRATNPRDDTLNFPDAAQR